MKKIRLLISIILVVCCLSVLSACESLPELQKPTNLKIELTNLTLSWKAVPDARLYTVSIQAAGAEAKEFMVSKTTYSLAFLTEGEYTIKVSGKKTVGDADVEYKVGKLTVKAPTSTKPAKKGCGGSAVASIFGVLALAGTVVVLRKKREE